jgi:transglutaminase-like putative cysteine protease
VHPHPAGFSEFLDAENNLVHFCWFNNMHSKLTVKSSSVINISDFNPFNFIIYPLDYNKLPFNYDVQYRKYLAPALSHTPLTKDIIEYAEQLKDQSNSNSVEFISNLTTRIFKDFILELRAEGSPHEPLKTFQAKRGSCRDLAWFQIQLLRHMGIATRFVSGYYFLPMEKPEYELHAWLEVFIPGAGWIGYDPSHGIATGNDHIPIASSADFKNTMAVTGTIRGDAASELQTELNIRILEK